MLIIKLNRLAFDNISLEMRKVNSRCTFPPKLDLKKHYYHTIMDDDKKANFNQQKQEAVSRYNELKEKIGKDDDADENKEGKFSKGDEKELKKLIEDIENMTEPARDENEEFWYKLVGINVHQGKASAGHYWSYINTKRATAKEDDEEDKITKSGTDKDPWMEFADTQVTNWDYDKFLEPRCFGSDKSAFGDFEQEGTSAYMLFYERVTKKNIRLVVHEKDTVTRNDATKLR